MVRFRILIALLIALALILVLAPRVEAAPALTLSQGYRAVADYVYADDLEAQVYDCKRLSRQAIRCRAVQAYWEDNVLQAIHWTLVARRGRNPLNANVYDGGVYLATFRLR